MTKFDIFDYDTEVETTREIVSNVAENSVVPKNTQGTVVAVYPIAIEVNFGQYGVWFISRKTIESDGLMKTGVTRNV